LEELVCVEAVSPEPPVSDQFSQKRSDETDTERVERARGKILRRRAIPEEVQQGELERELRARTHELSRMRARSSWASPAEKAAELAKFEAEIRDIKLESIIMQKNYEASLLHFRRPASLSKTVHLLPLRHRQLYFPSLTDN